RVPARDLAELEQGRGHAIRGSGRTAAASNLMQAARRSGPMSASAGTALSRVSLRYGQRGEQSLRVGVHRLLEQRIYRRRLNDAPGMHYADALAGLRNDAEIMANQHQRHAGLPPDPH